MLGKEQTKWLCVLVKTERVHRVQQIVSVDRFAFFQFALVTRPNRAETYNDRITRS
mgnify:CR=1 FL=1